MTRGGSAGGRTARAALLLAALVACRDPVVVLPPATLSFVLDAPFCSSRLPTEFLVDGQRVGVDTFRIHLPPDHTESSRFTVSAGPHLVGARVTLGTNTIVWPDARDTIFTFRAGEAVTRVLPFYCS